MTEPESRGETRRTPNGRFAPGASGNPAGRPPLAAELSAFMAVRRALTDEVIEGLAAKAAELGLAGDVAAIRLSLQAARVLGHDVPEPPAEGVERLRIEDATPAEIEVLHKLSRHGRELEPGSGS